MWRAPFALAILVVLTTSAQAHLSVLRQGPESDETPEADDSFGQALAVGDFNGDGRDDLATGAPLESNDLSPGPDHGIVVVNYGAKYGLTHVGAHTISPGAPADPVVRFGEALAAGDFDGDDYDDLAIGAPFADVGGNTDAGLIWIVYGSASGLSNSPVPWDQSQAGALVEDFDLFGFELAAGDLDLDGLDDLVVGSVGENGQEGAVSVFRGSAGGLVAPGFTFTSLDLGYPSSAGDQFGHALAIEDFEHTPSGDVAIGAPFWDYTLLSSPNAGRVFVVEIDGAGVVATTVEIITADEIADADVMPEANFGFSLAAGDFSGINGNPELAVGEPGYPDGGFLRAGRVTWFDQPDTPTGGVLRQQDFGEEPFTDDEFGYSLVVGDMFPTRTSLVVGTPGEYVSVTSEGLQVRSGMATLYYGGNFSWEDDNVPLRPDELNDFADAEARLGHAVAIGSFGDWNSALVAVGAPKRDFMLWLGEDDTPRSIESAGSVHTWGVGTGVYNMRARSAAAFNCFDVMVFSVRPFDRIRPASTTKVMTMLLMAEAIDQGLDPETTYRVPDYIAGDCYDGNKGGSQIQFAYEERVTTTNLLKMLASISANDAGYMLADIWNGFGGTYPNDGDCLNRAGIPDATVPFVEAMNDRADQLGMSNDTLFLTPVGRDQEYEYMGSPEKHRGTAADWGKLARAAVSDPYVRTLMGTTEWDFQRIIVLPDETIGFGEELSFSWLKKLINLDSRIIAGKSGGTRWGANCGIFSAEDDTGTQPAPVVAASFGTESRGWSRNRGAAMCAFAMEEAGCELIVGGTVPGPEPTPIGRMEGETTAADERAELHLETDLEATLALEAHGELTLNAAGVHAVSNCLEHSAGLLLGPGESGALSVTNFAAHDGLSVVNDGDQAALLQIDATAPRSASFTVTVQPGESFAIAPHTETVGDFELRVQNLESASSVAVGLQARWRFDLTLGDEPSSEQWGYLLERDAPAYRESIEACLVGLDAGTPGIVAFSLSLPGTPTAVGDEASRTRGAGALGSVRAFPSPFNARTRLNFELRQPGSVSVAVFDLRGRRVRQLVRSQTYDAGTHELVWDGQDDSGGAIASGVYYWRVSSAGEERITPVVLVE